MRRLITIAAGLALLGTSTAVANHAWGNYHWARTTSSFNLTLVDSVSTGAWDAALGAASTDWSKSTVLSTAIGSGATDKKTRQRCAAPTGQVRVCNHTYGNTGWLGVAGIYASGDHITKAYVKLNDTYFNTSTYNTPEWRRSVTCQEVGHTFGLDHQSEDPNVDMQTCMDYYKVPNQSPNGHDYEQLAIIYGHLDATSTVGGSTSTRPGRGKPFSQASRANGSVYVDRLPGGATLVRHVYWRPPGA